MGQEGMAEGSLVSAPGEIILWDEWPTLLEEGSSPEEPEMQERVEIPATSRFQAPPKEVGKESKPPEDGQVDVREFFHEPSERRKNL